jgi:hypothetical protein
MNEKRCDRSEKICIYIDLDLLLRKTMIRCHAIDFYSRLCVSSDVIAHTKLL